MASGPPSEVPTEEHLAAAYGGHLLQVGAHVHFATLATKLGISEGNARLTAFRMRKALRDYVEKEIRLTTINEDCAREELTAFRENIAAQN